MLRSEFWLDSKLCCRLLLLRLSMLDAADCSGIGELSNSISHMVGGVQKLM